MDRRVLRALLVLLAASIAVRPARAGGPEPSDRSFGVQTKLPARLTVTVTDHGQTCGEPADSTATWVLRAQVGGTERVVCARNDNGSAIRFPMCDQNSQPAARCSTNPGGVQGVTEGTLDPVGDLARWMQFKLYPTTIAGVLDGSDVSVTILADGCQKLMPNGKILSCTTDPDCTPACDLGLQTCGGNAFSVPCTNDTDCNFGACLLQGAKQLDFQDGTGNPAKGTRADYDLTLGFTPGVTDQGTCQTTCANDPALACQSNATCVSTCGLDTFSCTNDPSVFCTTDADCHFGACIHSCSNDPTVPCTTNADCNLVINIGNVPVMQDAACALAQCGDGFVDPGEQCDDGPLNGTPQSPSGCPCNCTLHTTTTTTLPCQVAATFTSIDCRLDALSARVKTAPDIGRVRASLLRDLDRAETSTQQAEASMATGKTKRTRAALRHAITWMIDFLARVGSPTGRRQIGDGTRRTIAEQGRAIRDDMRSHLQQTHHIRPDDRISTHRSY